MGIWICADERPAVTHFYTFEKTFTAPAGAKLTAMTCGDTRYQLYVNGKLTCEGPCQGSSYQRYYEETDLSAYLTGGENTVSAKVMYMEEGSFISEFRMSRPAFWMSGKLTLPDGNTLDFGTDGTWTCRRDDSTRFHHMPGVHTSVPPFEEAYGSPVLTDVPVATTYEPDLSNSGYNVYGLSEYYVLAPRPIPQMRTGAERPMKLVRQGRGFAEYDAGVYTTAKIRAKLSAKAGATVRFIYAECYLQQNEQGRHYKGKRDEPLSDGAALTGVFDTLHPDGGTMTFAPFWYRSFRFIRVEYDPDSDFVLDELCCAPYFYPLEETGGFTCSDGRINRIWEISKNTVLCCMHEMYVDCPYYEQQQYDMDSCLEMLFTLRLTSDGRMPFKSITDLAHSQMADGMIQANYPSVKVQIIPDFTLFWILMAREYLRYQGADAEKKADVAALLGTVDKALCSFESRMTPEGLIGATPYWPFVDWVPSWPFGVPTGGREQPLTVTCLMYAAALLAAADMAGVCGKPERAAEYRRRAGEMTANVNKYCYDEEAGLYRDTPTRRDFSRHTTLWAILSGAVDKDEAGALVDRTFDGHVPVNECTFSMNHYLFRALEAADRYAYAPAVFEGWQTMLDLGCTTWCENPGAPRSECHGWSSAPIYELSEMVLGVYPTGDGFSSVRVRPYVEGFGLTYARGTVPTPYGEISVFWEKKEGCLTLEVEKPAGAPMDMTVILPDGSETVMTKDKETFVCRL